MTMINTINVIIKIYFSYSWPVKLVHTQPDLVLFKVSAPWSSRTGSFYDKLVVDVIAYDLMLLMFLFVHLVTSMEC